MIKAAFCISIDTELLWGRKDLNYSSFIPKVRQERIIIKKLLSIFKKYEIHATWAIVGKLFTTSKNNKPNKNLWYAPDVVEMVSNTKNQEIACHSFTHPEFTKISRNDAIKEIEKCIQEAKKINIDIKSFIFPRNKIKHLDVLKRYNFLSFRGKDSNSKELLMLRLPPVYSPSLSNGLTNIRGSMYFVSSRGIKRFIPPYLRTLKIKLGINNAIKQGKIFHLWLHPVDLVDNSKMLFGEIENICKYVSNKKNKGLIEVKTMKEIASDFV